MSNLRLEQKNRNRNQPKLRVLILVKNLDFSLALVKGRETLVFPRSDRLTVSLALGQGWKVATCCWFPLAVWK